MIVNGSVLKSIDNSGVTKLKCFRILNSSPRKWGSVGNVIVGSLHSKLRSKTFKNKVFYGLIVGVKKKKKRFSGILIKFDNNKVVILNNKSLDSFLNTRIKFPVSADLTNLKNFKTTFFNRFML